MTYCIGQRATWERQRDIVSGPEIIPVWYGLTVQPQREKAVRDALRKRDIYSFYPSEERSRHHNGKRRTWERPIVSGHIYAKFTQQPQWDVLKLRRLITGVYSIGGKPIEIPRDVIRHLQGLTVEAERLREARAEMLRVRPGDQARIITGPLAGMLVDVVSIAAGKAWFSFVAGGKGSASAMVLERVNPGKY